MTEPSSHDAAPPSIPDHQLVRVIGRGSYGVVWLARNVMGTYRAVKVVYRDRFHDVRPFERELNGIKMFEPISRSHDGFVDILQVGKNEEEGYFYSVMELADAADGSRDIDEASYAPRTLAPVVAARKSLSSDDCVELGLSLSSAVAHLHEHGLIHRDIKPSNIIFVNGSPKLADIGMVTGADAASIAGGTIGYIPPEGTPSPSGDVYGLGKVLYEVSTGNDRLDFPSLPTSWDQATDLRQLAELNEILVKACEHDPARRYPSAREMHAELFLLRSGKSVKRLRLLERRQDLLTKVSIVAGILLLLAGLVAFQTYQEREKESTRLADAHSANAARIASQGDLMGALLWQGEALALDEHRPARAARHRMNIEATLRNAPRLVNLFAVDDRINDIAISPASNLVALATRSGALVVRDLRSLSPPRTFTGHSNTIVSVHWHPDGRHVATASADRTVRVWDVSSGEVHVLPHPSSPRRVRFTHQGDHLVSVDESGSEKELATIRVWDWRQGVVRLSSREHLDAILAAAISPDDRWLLTAGKDERAARTALESLSPAPPDFRHPSLSAYENWVYDCAFSPDGLRFATGSFDRLVRVWSDAHLQAPIVIPHSAPVRSVEFSPDGHYLLTASDDYTARLWDFKRLEEVGAPLHHPSFLARATFSPDGRLIVTATTDGLVYVWDLAPPSWERSVPTYYSPDGTRMATVVEGQVLLTDVASGRRLADPIAPSGRVRDIRFSETAAFVLVLTSEDPDPQGHGLSGRLWGIGDGGQAPHPFPPFRLGPLDPDREDDAVVQISRDGERMTVVSGNTMQLWDPRSGVPVGSAWVMPEPPQVALESGGRMAVVCAGSRALLIDAARGTEVAALPHRDPVETAVFSPDGSLVVTACRDNDERALSAHVWDARTGRRIPGDLVHADGIYDVTFSPDGRYLVTAGEDRLLKQWEVGSWREVRRCQYVAGFLSVEFDATGRRVVAASADHSVSVWDLSDPSPSGALVMPPIRLPWNLAHARFVGDGLRVLAKRLPRDRWVHAPNKDGWPDSWPGYVNSMEVRTWEWTSLDLRNSAATSAQLKALCMLLSGQRLLPLGTEPLSKADVLRLWAAARQPSAALPFFEFPGGGDLHWHGHEAERAERNGDIFGALFHTRRFLEISPADPTMRRRLAALQALAR